MDNTKRKQLREQYQSKPVVGGIYCVQCNGNQRKWIKSTLDMESVKSRFEFALQIKSCPDPAMQNEYLTYGAQSFTFTCLEELTKGETQTTQEFTDDIKALYEMWQEKEQR